jgi:hypothetical protein
MKKSIAAGVFLLSGYISFAQNTANTAYPFDPAEKPRKGTTNGEIIEKQFSDSRIYPGTQRKYWIYVPAGYVPEKPACLYICMDGIQYNAPTVFDNLIASGEMPVTIGVFIGSGKITNDKNETLRFNRSNEFDKTEGTITGRSTKNIRAVATGIRDSKDLLVTSEGDIYITQASDNNVGKLWLIKSDGTKRIINSQSFGGTYIAIYPNHKLLIQTEMHSQWIYSYVINSDGSIKDGQRFYWLHNTENFDFTGNGNMTFDVKGNMYVASAMGIQVCDQNGRVRAILTLPSGRISSVAFGGRNHDILYVVSDGKIFRRRMNVNGIESWMLPVEPVSQGAG